MLLIESNFTKYPEFKYTLETIFSDWLGIDFKQIHSNNAYIRIYRENGEELKINSRFFKDYNFENYDDSYKKFLSKKNYLLSDNLSNKLCLESIPMLFETDKKLNTNNSINFIDLDIFGVIFFMLSRVEEFAADNFDNHDRFEGKNSLSFKMNFLDKPIVDIYIEILWEFLKKSFTGLKRKRYNFVKNISCDCDNPFLYHYKFKNLLKRSGGDLIYRKSPSLFIKSLKGISSKSRSFSKDPFRKKIELIMHLNERVGNSVQFNFIPHMTSERYDGINYFNSSEVGILLDDVYKRGHKVGIHPGYRTYNNREMLKISVDKFLSKPRTGDFDLKGRQHYLRWKVGVTDLLYEDSNIKYDSSLGYADKGGFRCGTSKTFSIFSLKERKKLNLKEEPLHIMENTYFSGQYLDYKDRDTILEKMNYIKSWIKKLNGSLNLLWHNTSLFSDDEIEVYKYLIK